MAGGGGRRARALLRPAVLVPTAVVVAAVLVVGLALFQPWKLWVDDVVDEAFPTASAAVMPTSAPDATDAPSAPSTPASRPAGEAAATFAVGRFVSHEHATSGTVRILRLSDGRRVLRIEDLDTSNGPDLHVWLAAAPVKEGRGGWYVFDDDTHVELGKLKGNIGDQNYAVPASADLEQLRSVSIWCDRFNVSFGAATLSPV